MSGSPLHRLQERVHKVHDIEFDNEANTLSVMTDSITLEDVYLGPFKIQLNLKKLGEL